MWASSLTRWLPFYNPLVQALLSHNATVYMAARSESKASAAINELKSLTGKEAIFLKLDLANLKSVKAAAEEFIRYIPTPYCCAEH